MAALTLDAIREQADPTYPAEIIAGCGDALILFASGFLGRQDGIWILDAGMSAVCVDVRSRTLQQMAGVYPPEWEFVQADVYELLDQRCLPDADLVSVDCPSGHFERCADLLDRFCELARRYVVVGCAADTEIFPPSGWLLLDRRRRSDFAGGTYWAVLEREQR